MKLSSNNKARTFTDRMRIPHPASELPNFG
jgi:hypothetical protein